MSILNKFNEIELTHKFNIDCELIRKELSARQDYQNIINNIINGQPYIYFELIKKINNLTFMLCVGKKIENIPMFNKYSIYVPFEKNFTITDYIEKYSELNIMSYHKKSSNNLLVNIEQTLINLQNKEKKIISHNINIQESKKRKEFKENYYLIINFIKEHDKDFHKKYNNKNFYFLNFNYKKNTFYFDKSGINSLFDSVDNIFYLDSYKEELTTLYPLNLLYFKEDYDGEILDFEKSLERINAFNNMKNF